MTREENQQAIREFYDKDPEQFREDYETARALLQAGDLEGLVAWLSRENHDRAQKAAEKARS